MQKVNYKDEDVLVLASGKMIRGWAYDTHCNFHPKEDNNIIEVLTTIYIK